MSHPLAFAGVIIIPFIVQMVDKKLWYSYPNKNGEYLWRTTEMTCQH